jgi:hypothetical protein
MAKRSSAWKDHERAVAKALGGTRSPNTGKGSPDIEHPLWSIECKYRKQIPLLVTEGLAQARRYDDVKTPLLVLKEKNKKGAIVCMDIKDFVDWHGK